MQLYYYKDEEGNFGDDLNPLIWEHFIPDLLNDNADTLFIGIGTLLNDTLPRAKSRVVFGAGHGYGDVPAIDNTWRFYCVRGPLTAAKLGLSQSLAITDPALLATQLVTAAAPTQVHTTAFIPHHGSKAKGNWKELCKLAGIHYIDPASNPLEVIAQIRSAKIVICEAMHGAILADAFRVPWIPVKCYEHIFDFKWNDWCQSVGLAYNPRTLPSIYNIQRKYKPLKLIKSEAKHILNTFGFLPKRWSGPIPRLSSSAQIDYATEQLQQTARCEPLLSADALRTQHLDRLQEALEKMRRDYGQAS